MLLPPTFKQSYKYYHMITNASAVCVIATTKDGKFVCNREYRHPTKQFLLV